MASLIHRFSNTEKKIEEPSNYSFLGREGSFPLLGLWTFKSDIKVGGSLEYFLIVLKVCHIKMKCGLYHWQWLWDIYVLKQHKYEGSCHQWWQHALLPHWEQKHPGNLACACQEVSGGWWLLGACPWGRCLGRSSTAATNKLCNLKQQVVLSLFVLTKTELVLP